MDYQYDLSMYCCNFELYKPLKISLKDIPTGIFLFICPLYYILSQAQINYKLVCSITSTTSLPYQLRIHAANVYWAVTECRRI